MKTKTPSSSGFTLTEIMVVVAIVGLLAAIGIPNFVQARKTSQTNACINNLRQIDGAKQQWALEDGKGTADQPLSADLQPYLGRGDSGSVSNVCCPLTRPLVAMGGYTINSVGTPPVCQNYDSTNHPANMY
jgi:prepilin-type N-terminal cleavage/methylation domain-containing protein